MITFGDLVDPQQMTGLHTAALMVTNCIVCAWGTRVNYVDQTSSFMTLRFDIKDEVQLEHMCKEMRDNLPKNFNVKVRKPFIIIDFKEAL
jgi:hypothetical protein